MPFQLKKELKANMQYFNETLKADDSFDLIYRTFSTGGHMACMYFVDGFAKDDTLQKTLVTLEAVKEDDFPKDAHEFTKNHIDYIEVDILNDANDIVKNILSGVAVFFIDSYDEAIAIDARTYPARSVDEPEKDKVLRGSRDGFVETIVFNTALIRRRIRSPQLVNKMLSVGKSSQTDVVVSYMEGRCDEKLLDSIVKRIQNIDVDSLSMNQESLAESLYKRVWINPFPKFKYTERPDTAAASLLEGNIIILVDTSPAAIIIPASIFDIMEEADDFYFPPITGTYLRLSRFAVNIIALVLTPLFVLLMNNQQYIPKGLEFIVIKDTINIPLILQFFILEFTIDGLKMASLSTPNMLSTPLSIVAGLVIGDFAVSSGWFNSECMLYMAFVIIANYSQISFEFGYALKFMRIILLILTYFFDLWGFIIGLIITICAIAFNKTLGGHSYLYPLIPFNGRNLLHRFFRVKITHSKNQ